MGRSESTGATSPNSDLNGAPKRRRAVGEFSSAISLRTWWAISSRLRSAIGQKKAFEEEESEHPDSVLASRSGSGPEVVRNRWSWRTPCVRPPSVDGGFRWGQLLCSRGRRPLVATTSCEKIRIRSGGTLRELSEEQTSSGGATVVDGEGELGR